MSLLNFRKLGSIILRTAIVTTVLWSAVGCKRTIDLPLVPMPQSVSINSGYLAVPDQWSVSLLTDSVGTADLTAYLQQLGNFELSKSGTVSLIRTDDRGRFPKAESYSMTVTRKGVEIVAADNAGLFYGLQTLLQLSDNTARIPCLSIDDYPRFGYRGMHLDCSRHFFDKQFVIKQLDQLSRMKINTFHWHLTDGGGWRLQIPDYPLLTEGAAWRDTKYYMDWWRSERHYSHQGAEGAYGGYYTADDVREVLEYARLRHITVIPEIEMPGHSEEVTAFYPELSCAGVPYSCGELCIGNEATFEFLENVLDYVMELFPSEYIHIGGDEAEHGAWKKCEKCQARIEELGLGDEYGLQGYLTERIERYLNDHGRKMIGWDEIAECNISPSATIMAWRGIDKGIAAAKEGHRVIMTPGSHCYLDHYQADPSTQPAAIGGYNTLENTYSFDPAHDSLDSAVAELFDGLQGNVWAEYMPEYSHAEYMIYPRMAALAECAWTMPAAKDWEGFKPRVNRLIESLVRRGYNPYRLSDVATVHQNIDYKRHCIKVSLESERTPVEIRYTTNGTEPTVQSSLYKNELRVTDSLKLKMRLFQNGKPIGPVSELRTDYHKAVGKQITYTEGKSYYTYDERYKGGGDNGLIDGLRGSKTYTDGRWQGFCPRDMEVIIDLGKVEPISRVMANFMQEAGPWIFYPSKVEVWVSTDGTDFRLLGTDYPDVGVDVEGAMFRDFGWKGAPVEARYVRYSAFQSSKRAFIFTDEIVIQ